MAALYKERGNISSLAQPGQTLNRAWETQDSCLFHWSTLLFRRKLKLMRVFPEDTIFPFSSINVLPQTCLVSVIRGKTLDGRTFILIAGNANISFI